MGSFTCQLQSYEQTQTALGRLRFNIILPAFTSSGFVFHVDVSPSSVKCQVVNNKLCIFLDASADTRQQLWGTLSAKKKGGKTVSRLYLSREEKHEEIDCGALLLKNDK